MNNFSEKINNTETFLDKKESGLNEVLKKEEKFQEKKTKEQELLEITQQISNEEDLLSKEKSSLAEKRAKLGLPEVDEETASTKAIVEKIEKLEERKVDLEKSFSVDEKKENNKENISEKEENKVEKIKPQEFNDFIMAVEGVARTLRERDSQRLDQLTEDPGKLAGAISSLKSALGSQKPDIDSVGKSISRISNFLGEIGERQARVSMKENPESLGKLAFYLGKIDQERQALGARISKKENSSEIMPSLSRIESAVKNKKEAINKKLAFLRQYGGR